MQLAGSAGIRRSVVGSRRDESTRGVRHRPRIGRRQTRPPGLPLSFIHFSLLSPTSPDPLPMIQCGNGSRGVECSPDCMFISIPGCLVSAPVQAEMSDGEDREMRRYTLDDT